MLSQLREPISKILQPIIVFFAKLRIHPTVFTLFGVILSISAGIFLAIDNFLVALILIIAGSAMDYIDGGVARYRNLASKQGSFLDSTVDRISDLALFGGIALSGYVDKVTGIIMVASALLISYIRAKGESVGIQKMAVGIMERAERLLFLFVLILLSLMIPQFHEPFFSLGSFHNGSYFTIGYMILTGLSVITILQRIIYASIQLNKIEVPAE
ncbi:MAG: CDP-alcohol phosphatidyltransferase family protein [Candidatus Heimdallarchaeaceae archaeon]